MPLNGSGGVTQPTGSVYPAVASTVIESAKFNTSIADIYTVLASALYKDGQQTATSSVPFAQGISTNTIAEQTSSTGVTVDGALIKDGTIEVSVIRDDNQNEAIIIGTTASAVNEITVTNAATSGVPVIAATGGDTNIPLRLTPKGTGDVQVTDGTDPTKVVAIEASGLTTGTTRTITVPDENITLGDVTKTGFTTGDVKLSLKTTADTGWVLMNDGTIGNASSGGTTRANADTEDLFTLLWTNAADAQCPVSTGRGASAAADYAANKTIKLPLALGRALATYGTGASLTARVLAATLGAETHTLADSELPTTVVTGTGLGPQYTSQAGGSFPGAPNTTLGGGGDHNNMQPTLFLNVMVKL